MRLNFIDKSYLYTLAKMTRSRVLKTTIVVFLACIANALVILNIYFPFSETHTTSTDAKSTPVFFIYKSEERIRSDDYPTIDNWQVLSNDKFNLGKYEHAVVRVTIENDVLPPSDNTYIAFFRNNIFTNVELHTGGEGETSRIRLQAMGENNKVIAALIPNIDESSTYYISLSGRYLRGELHLLSEAQLSGKMENASILNALFYGFVLVFTLLGVLAWLLFRKNVFLLYSLLQSTLILWIAAGEGTIFKIHPNAHALPFLSANALGLLYFICLAKFSQLLLGLKKKALPVYRLLNVGKVLLLAIWCLFCFSFNQADSNLYQAFYGLALIICFAILLSVVCGALFNIKVGNNVGYFFLAGMSSMLFCGSLAGLSISAYIDFRADWGIIKFGAILEMVCLATGLMYMQSQLMKKQQNLLHDYVNSTEQLSKTRQEFAEYAQDKESRGSKPILEILNIFENLLFVKAYGNYSIAYHQDGIELKELVVDMSLTKIEEVLEEDGLVRCHKSYLVSTKKDFKFLRRTSADYSLALDNHTVPIGRKYQSIIKPIFAIQ